MILSPTSSLESRTELAPLTNLLSLFSVSLCIHLCIGVREDLSAQ